MIQGKLRNGFEYGIPDESLNSMELLDALADVDAGDATALSRASLLLLGKEQREKLYDHIRTEKGNVPIEVFTECITEIMEHEEKNSLPSPASSTDTKMP